MVFSFYNNFNMIDEEKQAMFTGELGQFCVNLGMKKKELIIQLQDNDTLHKYHATIDHQFFETQDKFFTSYFQSPEDVFTHLTEYFSQVVIEQGVLRFTYSSGKKLQNRDVIIELQKQEVDDNALAHLKIAKVKVHFQAELEKRDNRIAALQGKLYELMTKFEEYKKESEFKMERLKQRLQKEETRSKAFQEKLHKGISDSYRNPRYPQPISQNPNNPHQQYYILSNITVSSAKLTRIGGGIQYYNFVNKTELIPEQKNKFAVRMIEAIDNCLMIGMCTEKCFGNISSHEHAESIYYFCLDDGRLYEKGVRKDLYGCGSCEGELVECEIDLLEEMISWSKKGVVFLKCAIPAYMKDTKLYFSIILLYEGDAVEVSSI